MKIPLLLLIDMLQTWLLFLLPYQQISDLACSVPCFAKVTLDNDLNLFGLRMYNIFYASKSPFKMSRNAILREMRMALKNCGTYLVYYNNNNNNCLKSNIQCT